MDEKLSKKLQTENGIINCCSGVRSSAFGERFHLNPLSHYRLFISFAADATASISGTSGIVVVTSVQLDSCSSLLNAYCYYRYVLQSVLLFRSVESATKTIGICWWLLPKKSWILWKFCSDQKVKLELELEHYLTN